MLAEDTTLLEGAERSQIMESKYKEVPPGENTDYWLSKKAKGKQPVRYCRDIGIKIESAKLL